MHKNLNEKQIGHAFFFALKFNDFQHALFLLSLDAPVNTAYFLQQDTMAYTINLLVGRVAQTVKKYGIAHSKSQLVLKIFDLCMEKKPDLRCHCTQKNPHYCALSQAFKYIRFETEDDLLKEDNLIILKLLFNGATYKNLSKSKEYVWLGINTLNSYIQTKKTDVIELLKTNRHAKCVQKENRHKKCALNYQLQKQQN